MSAPIGGSLRVPSFVVVGLLLAAIGVRPGPATGQAPRTPPVPDKSTPAACSSCENPLPGAGGVTQEALTNYWIKDCTFYVMLKFSDKKKHDDFINKSLNQQAYLCYKLNGQGVGYRWPILRKRSKGDGAHVLVAFRVCIPDGMKPTWDDESGGTATGTVIIVTNPTQQPSGYQAEGLLTGLEPM